MLALLWVPEMCSTISCTNLAVASYRMAGASPNPQLGIPWLVISLKTDDNHAHCWGDGWFYQFSRSKKLKPLVSQITKLAYIRIIKLSDPRPNN